MSTSNYLLKEQLLQDFVAAQDQIVVLAAQRGIFLPTHDEKVEMSEGDRERAIADFKKILEQL
ncbi:MAG: hypothetical protein WBV50_04245 [Candidatus Acidiferrum sp.]